MKAWPFILARILMFLSLKRPSFCCFPPANSSLKKSPQDLEDKTIKTLADKGYKMIFSNYDALYLDCGFENYIGLGNNWCSPYKSNSYSLLFKKFSTLSGWFNFPSSHYY
jgi:hypothetical protein